jgi:hypothetical protein
VPLPLSPSLPGSPFCTGHTAAGSGVLCVGLLQVPGGYGGVPGSPGALLWAARERGQGVSGQAQVQVQG